VLVSVSRPLPKAPVLPPPLENTPPSTMFSVEEVLPPTVPKPLTEAQRLQPVPTNEE